MYVCMDVHGCMDAWMDGCFYGCMDVCMYGCMHGCMDGWMLLWMYGCMDVCMDVWMYVCMYVYHPVIKYGLLENIPFSSMIFPAVKRHLFYRGFSSHG